MVVTASRRTQSDRKDNLERHLFTEEGCWLEKVTSQPPESFRRRPHRKKPVPALHLTRAELVMDLETALGSVSPRHRLALLLHLKRGYPRAAVAAFLGISRCRSEHLVSEAKKVLRRRLPHPEEL